MIQSIKLGDAVYNLSDMNEDAKRHAVDLHNIENRLLDAGNLMKILQRARKALVSDLKNEIISAKSGLSIEDE